jgi:transposase
MPRIKYQEAIGLEARRGKPPIGNKPGARELRRLYTGESKSIREIAGQLGCTKDMVYRALTEYGIKRRERSKTKESVLSTYPLSHLENKIAKDGYREAAKKLGVGSSTLYFYVKRRKREP